MSSTEIDCSAGSLALNSCVHHLLPILKQNECSISTHAKLLLQTHHTALNDKPIAGRERRNYKLQAIGTCTTTHL